MHLISIIIMRHAHHLHPTCFFSPYLPPNPELNPGTGCRHPLDLQALDKTDEVCRLHDKFYCNCEKIYGKKHKGETPPNPALIAMRSTAQNVNKDYFASLDEDYLM